MFTLIVELNNYFLTQKEYSRLPRMIMRLIFGGLIVLSHGLAVTPFLYAIF